MAQKDMGTETVRAEIDGFMLMVYIIMVDSCKCDLSSAVYEKSSRATS